MSQNNSKILGDIHLFSFAGVEVCVLYYKCPKCGRVYYSAAVLKDEQLNCDECGAKVEPFEEKPAKASNSKVQATSEKSLSAE